MKLLISTEALRRHARSVPAHAGYTTAEFSWRDKLKEIEGKWVTVETQYLFENQFNIVEGNLRVYANQVDGIDWEEIGSFDNFKRLVTERYAKDWPGQKLHFREVEAILKRQTAQPPVQPTNTLHDGVREHLGL
jgi:hypothetical protein